MKNNKGFTLVELLAVIVIMGILMMIAIPSITKTIEKSRKDSFVDIAKSYEGFGFGCSAPSKVFISQKFYRLIMDNKLNRNLEFVPVDLKD